jgi:hypothetical protein
MINAAFRKELLDTDIACERTKRLASLKIVTDSG